MLQGFPPLLGDQPRVLILGSMPSAASLHQQQYYGHLRNAFWPIMAALFDWPAMASLGFGDKLQAWRRVMDLQPGRPSVPDHDNARG